MARTGRIIGQAMAVLAGPEITPLPSYLAILTFIRFISLLIVKLMIKFKRFKITLVDISIYQWDVYVHCQNP